MKFKVLYLYNEGLSLFTSLMNFEFFIEKEEDKNESIISN